MKTQQSLLALKKIQIARVNSFLIVGRGGGSNDDLPLSSLECFDQKSRTISGNQTQTYTNAIDCEGNANS